VAAARVDAAAQVVQVGAGERPVKRPGGGVVAVLEGQQPGGECGGVAEVGRLDDFPLNYGEDDLVG